MTLTPLEPPPLSHLLFQTLAWIRSNNFKPVLLKPRSKAAADPNWAKPTYKPPSDDKWRVHPTYGIGCITGPANCGPIDIDLDCSEATFFAPIFFPATNAVFGRKSKPRSHLLFKVEASSYDKQAFTDPVTRKVILEIRGDGGHQTVFPGSLHEDTGELIEWAEGSDPNVSVISTDTLELAARRTVLASLIARHVWAPGNHNEPTVLLSGVFYYLEWPLEEAERFIQALMDYDDTKGTAFLSTVRLAYKRGEAGEKVKGANKLRQHINNDALTDKILELAGSPTINLLNEYNDKFACVSLSGKFRIAATGEPVTFFTKEDWINFTATDYSPVKNDKGVPVPKSKLWLSNPRRRQYDGIEFVPGGETRRLNLWTGWPLEPIPHGVTDKQPHGNCTAWLELLDLICSYDASLAKWLTHWFANIIRTPMEKSRTAPVIISHDEGVGKTLLVNYFGKILGSSFVHVSNPEHIHGKFNNHIAQCLLLHSDEALYAGDRLHASIIRSLITDDTWIWEQKGINAHQIDNYIRLILTSNDFEKAAPAQAGDRRYTVIVSKEKASPSLIERVLNERRGTGPAALMHHLMNMEYDPVLANTTIKTAALVNIKLGNTDPIEQWWYSLLSDGVLMPDYLKWCQQGDDPWPMMVSNMALYLMMVRYMKSVGKRAIPHTISFISRLDRMVGITLNRDRISYSNPYAPEDSVPREIFELPHRQRSITNLPSLEHCRQVFEQHLGQKIEWDAIDDEPDVPQFIKSDRPRL